MPKTQHPKALKIRFRLPHCRLTTRLQGTPANIRLNLILAGSTITGLHFRRRQYLHSNFRGGLRKTHVFWNRVHNVFSRSSKVVDFGTNRKRVCDFLLDNNSNLVHILPRFRDKLTAGFLLRRTNLPLFHKNLGCSHWTRLATLWLRGAKCSP